MGFMKDIDDLGLVTKLSLTAVCIAASTIIWLHLFDSYQGAEFAITY